VFYRANERAVLDTLYKGATVEAILAALAKLPDADAAFATNRWKDLVNLTNLDAGDQGFPSYTPNGFRFPAPDNDGYVIPGTAITLDGASRNTYFYYASEMSDQMRLGPRSPIARPIHLVNAYIASEGITAFKLYRATSAADAATMRTMTLVRSFAGNAGAETELFDDFADLAFPPFGDPLYYRVVALREIVNERDAKESIPSQASGPARASIVDVRNPVAPRCASARIRRPCPRPPRCPTWCSRGPRRPTTPPIDCTSRVAPATGRGSTR
jgi:hypothetical protein